jgi:hypothetical protein
MSFLVKSPKLAGIGANQQAQASSYREAEPIPVGFGQNLFGAHWLCDAFNWREAPAGSNKPNYQYCSIAFGLRAGVLRRVGLLKQDGKPIWNFDYEFAPGEEYHDFTINASMSLGQAWVCRIYRGTETQLPDAYLCSGTGQDHPAYRGIAYAVMRNIDLGSGNTSIPSFSIECDVAAPDIGSDFDSGSAYGVNPIAAIYGLMRDVRAGDFDADLLDETHWGLQADALHTTGVATRSGQLTFIHPFFAQGTSLADAVSQILAYFDGYVYAADGQLRIAWFPNKASATTVPTITEADITERPGGGGFPDWNQGATNVAVLFTDRDRDYEDGSAVHRSPANREVGIAAAPARKDRPFVHWPDQAAMFAAELSVGDVSDASVTLSVLKSRAVRLDGTPLIPGDVILWQYDPHALALRVRVVARRIRAGAAADMLEVVRERGAFPAPYVAEPDEREPYVPVPPVDVANHRLWFLPAGFGGGRQITLLVNRPAAQNIATRLHLSANGSAPWEEILTLQSFAARGTVDAGGASDAAAVVRISSTSLDLVRMQAQSALAQVDDTLLLLIGDELMSVGAITAIGGGVYDLAVLRGRQGTTAAAHAGAAEAWLFYAEELFTVTHAEFYDVRVAGAYDVTRATKRFKLQAVSADGSNAAAPADPGIAFVFPDLTETDSAGTRTFRSPNPPTGALRVGDLWFDTNDGNRQYRWSGSAWVDVSDDRIDDNDAAVRALLDQVARDTAQFVAAANDQAAALLRELEARAAAVSAESAARTAAILTAWPGRRG